jgi:catalase
MSPDDLGGPHRVESVLAAMERYLRAVPGFRRAHARGVGFRGRFTPSPEAAELSAAEHLQQPVDTVVRLSNGGVSPYTPDRSNAKRGNTLGIAVRYELPSGGYTVMTGLSLSAFPPRVPDDFLALVKAQRPALPGGLPNPLRFAAFLAPRPFAFAGVKNAATLATTKSFATTRFNGIHAFYAVAADGVRQPFRHRWIPLAGIARMPPEQDPILPPQYLMDEIRQLVQRAPVEWDLVFQLGEPGDPTDDLTKRWPEGRRQVVAGRLVIDRLHEDQDLVDRSVFDPTVVPPGIELSDDPILHFRSEIYAESHRRRTSEERPAIKPG